MFGGFPYGGSPFADTGDATLGISVQLTGVSAVGRLGNVDVVESVTFVLTGVNAVGAVGSVTIAAEGSVVPTGVYTVVRLNRVNVWGLVDTAQSPNWAEVIAA